MVRRGAVTAVGAFALVAASMMPTPAWAAPTTQVVQGDVIRLVSVADWEAAARLLPGEPVRWDVSVSADAPDPGTVALAVSAQGDAPLTVDVALCMSAWEATGCPGGATVLRTGWSIPRDGGEIPLTEFSDVEVAHLRLAITLGAEDAGGRTDIRVHAQGAGESAVIGPGGGLATTGLPSIAPWTLGAGGLLVAIGTLLVLARRRRRDERAVGGS